MSERQRAVEFVRRAGKRLSGPLARNRTGRFYVWTRVLLGRVERFARRGSVPGTPAPVTLEALPVRAVGATYRELEPPAPVVSPPPGWVWPSKFAVPARSRGAPPRGQGVVEIPGGTVFGPRGFFGPDPDGVLLEVSSLWAGDEAASLAQCARALAVGVEELDGVAMSLSISSGGPNHAHALLQSVPHLELLRRGFGFEADRFLLTPQPAMIEALTILGIPTDRLLFVPFSDGPAHRCQMLRAATSPDNHEFGIDWVTDFLHELFLPDSPVQGSRRLYVRRGVARRKVLNEDDVLELLEPAGFEALSMDGRSIAQQAALFASADVVVATHGAALANLVFARPGTTVIELMGANTASVVFAELCWRRGLDYHLIMGTEPGPPDRWWTWQRFADTVVDVGGLRTLLGGLGLG
ncbi:MAG TPA: glycosyltransferase family 61 protein [Acidimicrobiia bacterium]|nr:glycosyltransferase family 61 protein [Acidimicrobiia bacterium]